jgi:biofilm PGA synthesis protein PgaA
LNKKNEIARAVLLVGLVAANMSHAAMPDTGESEFRRALTLNERGLGREALPILADLKDQYPEILRYRFDYAAVAASSGEYAAALAAVGESLEREAPRYVLDALFDAAFHLADEVRAERLYALLDERFGGSARAGIRLSRLHLQLGHNDKALVLSARLQHRYPDELEVLDSRAYVLRESRRPGEALLVYQEIARRFPDNRDAPKASALLLAELGATGLSQQAIETQQIGVDTGESLRFAGERGAQLRRWSAADAEQRAHRQDKLDRALATLIKARDRGAADAGAVDATTRIRGELVLAYHARGECGPALREYETLISQNGEIGDEIRLAAAACYSSMRRYSEAEALLHRLVEADPESFERRVAWIYALSDLDRFDEAERESRELIARLARTDLDNAGQAAAYTSARQLNAMLAAYRNRLDEGAARLARLQADAPASLDVTEASGLVAAWRGLPRKAEENFRIVLGEQPEHLDSRLGLANSYLDRGDAAPLRALVDELGADYSTQRSVGEAKRRLELNDSYYVVSSFTFGGDQEAVAGNRTLESDVKAYSKPFGDDARWRAFTRYRDLQSGPVVDTSANSASAGLRYRVRDAATEIEAGSKGYARIETSRSLSDQWSANLSLENNIVFRPARAVADGVTADTASFGLDWRQDERFAVAGGYRYTGFSDNRRDDLYLAANKNLYTDFDRRFSVGARVSEQRNSNTAVAYFSPSRLREASLSAILEFRLWQNETRESSIWHRLWATAGQVDQEGFSAHAMSNIGYGQEIAFSDALRLRWSIATTRYPFDGVASTYYTGNVGFEGYF